jgi:hypothetical protein
MTTSEIELRPPTMDRRIAAAFGLEGDNWMRHANPVSVWTRFSVVPLIALAVWSRAWIGWYCVIPLTGALVWMMVNPLLFRVPSTTRSWASKAVLGERIWTERVSTEIPTQFRSPVPNLVNAVSGLALLLLAEGLLVHDGWLVGAAIAIVYLAKLWYLDRMALLFDAVKEHDAEVASWELGS